MPQEEIVIRAPDGTEHVFPPGFDPRQAAGIVRQRLGSDAPAPPVRPPRMTGEQAIQAISVSEQERTARGLDLLRGAGAGLATMVFRGGDVLRRGLGMERVIDRPAVQAGMTPPPTSAGRIGYGAEQLLEYAIPAGRVAKGMAAAPGILRAATQGVTAAGIAGAQTGGDVGAMGGAAVLGGIVPPVLSGAVRGVGAVGRATQRVAAGAQQGGVGGALAALVRTTAPLDPKRMLIQALKPRATQTRFVQDLDLAFPELKATESILGRSVDTLDDLTEALHVAKRSIQQQLTQLRGPQQAISASADLSPVAVAMVRSIPKKLHVEHPAAVKRLIKLSDVYRRRFPIEEIEQLLKETNAELAAFYQLYPQAAGRAVRSNVGVASLEAQAKSLRDVLYQILDRPGQGAAARELNRRYGTLLAVEDAAARRANVALRQQPESLSEQIGAVRAAADMARGAWRIAHGDVTGAADIAAAHAGRQAAKSIKESQTTDALIRRAFAAYRGRPSPIVMPPPVSIRGFLPRGPIPLSSGVDPSFVRAVPAGRSIQRDPRTGRMRRIYLGEER